MEQNKVNELLTLDMNNSKKKPIDLGVLTLGNSTPNPPWKQPNYRSPWDKIDEKFIKGMNLSVNLNIDPSVEWYENTKKVQIPKVLLFFEKMKMERIINKYIIVYEWGKYGKKEGKLHYHMLVKTTKKNELVTEIIKEFNNKTNCSHRTIRVNWLKDVQHRLRYINYMKKEQQNKIKCLYYE